MCSLFPNHRGIAVNRVLKINLSMKKLSFCMNIEYCKQQTELLLVFLYC